MDGDWLALGAVAALALAGSRRRGSRTLTERLAWLGLNPDHKAAFPVPQVLSEIGLEVGDYGRDAWFVLTDDADAYQVKLEGWGAECVEGMCPAIPDVQQKTAIAEAHKLAAQWKRQGWRAGVWNVADSEVWAMTWGVNGPLEVGEDRFDEDDVLDIRQ